MMVVPVQFGNDTRRRAAADVIQIRHAPNRGRVSAVRRRAPNGRPLIIPIGQAEVAGGTEGFSRPTRVVENGGALRAWIGPPFVSRNTRSDSAK